MKEELFSPGQLATEYLSMDDHPSLILNAIIRFIMLFCSYIDNVIFF